MKKTIALFFCLFTSCHLTIWGKTITVSNITELQLADKQAQPGDLILIKNAEWNNVNIILSAKGTELAPITFRPVNAGGLTIVGQSNLSLGGSWLIVDGWYFSNGNSGKKAVIDFQTSSNQVANHCRITNCVIDGFNNKKRLEENYWV
ncbi:MAG: alginate lyase, partial [Sediminibacterium sp.]|nr:alginate lyase [Sediminibacterium sp.]